MIKTKFEITMTSNRGSQDLNSFATYSGGASRLCLTSLSTSVVCSDVSTIGKLLTYISSDS
jgi:hypothetical protein